MNAKEFKQFRIDCSQRSVIDDVDKCHIYGMVHPVFCVTERKRCPRMHDGPVVFPSGFRGFHSAF